MKKFRGVFPAVVAPQDDKNEILFDVMGDLVRRQVADGAGGFLVNGHTGELSLLTGDERREAIRTVRAAIGPDVPILAGIHTQGLGAKFAAQCESAAECGADAILMFSPFSFARGAFQYAPEAVVDYYRQASQLTPIPMWFMQYRPQTNLMMPRHVLRQIAALPNVSGIKQEVEDDIEYERDLVALRQVKPDLAVFAATDRGLFGNYALGADGCTIGLANFVKPVKKLQDAIWANDLEGARRASLHLMPLMDAIYGRPSYRWSSRLKYALHAAGYIPTANIRTPLFPARSEERKEIDAILQAYLD
ncbi:MAG TPA: dihydrodipicolinate synthase family protein [Steroidobacteraceae bacterium]|nr:dihydrodipicolinate synthase family protein [Steroidobacteraceae bacterium]HRX89466.1 dihydrodipicolinate synthase family protein [Steroidobacteraceae bacterium]